MTSAGKKVAPVEIYTNTIQRPSLLPAVCAPQASVLSAAWLPAHESLVPSAAERVEVPQVHQVRVQAELALTLAAAGGSYRVSGLATTGFGSSNGVDSAMKRMTDGANGVPPRGRPV
jgi:hypothetical protein